MKFLFWNKANIVKYFKFSFFLFGFPQWTLVKDKNFFLNSQKLASIKVTKTTLLFNMLQEL